MRRREFLAGSAGMLAGAAVLKAAPQEAGASLPDSVADSKEAAARIPRVREAGMRRGEMLYRPLGTTGVEVSVIGLGGAHLGGLHGHERRRGVSRGGSAMTGRSSRPPISPISQILFSALSAKSAKSADNTKPQMQHVDR